MSNKELLGAISTNLRRASLVAARGSGQESLPKFMEESNRYLQKVTDRSPRVNGCRQFVSQPTKYDKIWSEEALTWSVRLLGLVKSMED